MRIPERTKRELPMSENTNRQFLSSEAQENLASAAQTVNVADDLFSQMEVRLALRNRGMPLEAMRDPVTPTSLHYLLNHFDIPTSDAATWSLDVRGAVSNHLHLNLVDLKSRPIVSVTTTMECAGNGRAFVTPRSVSQPWHYEGVSTAKWTGTPLQCILDDASLDETAVDIVFTGVDRGIQGGEIQSFQRSLSVEEAYSSGAIVTYEMNGGAIPPQHGYPLRLIVPGWYGMTNVKWLTDIEVVSKPFRGYQMVRNYRYAFSENDPGEPVTLMKPRALMIPPGIPDFLTQVRIVEAGKVTLSGRAWSGHNYISKVEVSADDGDSWYLADIDQQRADSCWCGWKWCWNAMPGKHVLGVRATDASGNTQPTSSSWNYYGVGNNTIQRVAVVIVRPDSADGLETC